MKSDATSNEVWKLPVALRARAEQMLLEGAAPAEVAAALQELNAGVTPEAVEGFYLGNLRLQQERIRRQVRATQALKKFLSRKPSSAEARLAEVALFTGVARLSQEPPQAGLRQSLGTELERENRNLRQRALRLFEHTALVEEKIEQVRLKVELAKWQLAKRKLLELKPSLEGAGKEPSLAPEAIRKLQGIYALIAQGRHQNREAENSRQPAVSSGGATVDFRSQMANAKGKGNSAREARG